MTAEHIVLATHYPMVNVPGLYFLKLHQSRSYVVGLEGGPDVDGMYIDKQAGGLSLRNYGDMLLLGGGGHKTGKPGGGWAALREVAQQAYPARRSAASGPRRTACRSTGCRISARTGKAHPICTWRPASTSGA